MKIGLTHDEKEKEKCKIAAKLISLILSINEISHENAISAMMNLVIDSLRTNGGLKHSEIKEFLVHFSDMYEKEI